MAQTIMERLKFPTSDIKYVTTMIKEHMRWHFHQGAPTNRALRRAIASIGEENIIDMLKLNYCDQKANLANTEIPKFDWYHDPIYRQYVKMKQSNKPMRTCELSIDGHDLIAMGFLPSPIFTTILDKCMDAVSEGLPNKGKDLFEFIYNMDKKTIQ